MMGKRIQKILDEERRKQPIKELERKWTKARGRHSKHIWTAEWLDLAHARGERMYQRLNGLQERE